MRWQEHIVATPETLVVQVPPTVIVEATTAAPSRTSIVVPFSVSVPPRVTSGFDVTRSAAGVVIAGIAGATLSCVKDRSAAALWFPAASIARTLRAWATPSSAA